MEAFDIESLTLGEMAAAQEASGLSGAKLLSPAYRVLLVLFVQRLRSSGQPMSWRELTNLRVVDISSGQSPSQPASPSPKSSGSD